MSQYQSGPVTQRLDRLERENWYWKRATLLLLMVIGAAILMGQATKQNVIEGQIVKAQSLEIIDDEGKTRASLIYDIYTGSVTLEMRSKYNETRARIFVGNDGAIFTLGTRQQYTLKEMQVLDEYYKKRSAVKIMDTKELEKIDNEFDPILRNIEKVRGTHILLDARRYKQSTSARLRLNGGEGDSTIEVRDQKGTQAILGNTTLEHTTTGVSEKRPALSLVLLNKDEKVFWKTP